MTQKLNEAQRALVENNLRLVTWYIQKKVPYWTPDEYEDLWQVGAMALCMAAVEYDPAMGVKFSTLASRYIANYVWNSLRTERAKRAKYAAAHLEDRVNFGEKITLADRLHSVETGQSSERLLVLMDHIDRLRSEEREAILLHADGYTQNEIAEKMQTSQPSVCRIIRRTMTKLRIACSA